MDSASNRLEGIWVDAYDTDGYPVASTWTETDGTYALTLSPSNYYVRTDALDQNYVDEWYDNELPMNDVVPLDAELLTVSEGVTNGGVDFELEEGAQISGVVEEEVGGAPIGDIYVDVYDTDGNRMDSTWTDTNGAYVIRGLPTGTHGIRTDTYPLDYADEWYGGVPAIDREIPDDATTLYLYPGYAETNIDFSLGAGAGLEGQVTNSAGGMITNVMVDAYLTDGTWVDYAITDANGDYAFVGLPSGDYYVRTFTPYDNFADEWYNDVPVVGLDVPEEAFYVPLSSGTTVSNIVFVLDPGATIGGVVRDDGGTPLTNVMVDAYTPDEEWQTGADTGVGGAYTIDGLPAGTFYLRTYSAGLNLVDEWYDNVPVLGGTLDGATGITVAAGTVSNGIDFALSEGGMIAGTVTDTGGVAIAGATIDVYGSTSGEWAGNAIADTNGAYLAIALPAGDYALHVTAGAQGYADEWYDNLPDLGNGMPTNVVTPTVTGGATNSGVDFILERGAAITGLVTDTALTPAPLAGVEVSILTATGSEIADAITAYDGTYEFLTLPSTTVYVKATADSLNHAAEWHDDVTVVGTAIPTNAIPLVLAPAATSTVNFALAPGGSFTGLVTDVSTQLLDGIAVDVYGADTNWHKTVTTDSDGTYSVAGLPAPGSYFARTFDVVGAYAGEWYDDVPVPYEGIPAAAASVPVATGMYAGSIDFVLATNGSVAGTVSDAASSPLQSIELLLYSTNGTLMRLGATGMDGTYSLSRVTPGNYYVLARPVYAAFSDEWYDDVPDAGSGIPAGAAMITVTDGESVADIDLTLGYYVVGTYPVDGTAGILWQAASGSTYRVMQSDDLSTWTNAPTTGTSAVQKAEQTATAQGILEYRPPVDTCKYYRIELVP